jgi:proline iminopeptidase
MTTRIEPESGLVRHEDEAPGTGEADVAVASVDRPAVSPVGDRVDGRLALAAPAWGDRRTGAAAAIGAAVVWGLAVSWWTPRGPLTTGQALWSIVGALAVGGLAGFALRSRWAMVVAPVGFAAVFELARLGIDGPTVDGFHLSTYGIFAMVVGRGFHGLVSLFPLMCGAAAGAATARRLHNDLRTGERPGRYARSGLAVLAGAALVVLSVAVARPARTDPITGPDGQVLPASIAELSTVTVNGHDLQLMIRGHDADNPVLLFLAGGPGGSELGAMRNHLAELEKHFVVATWDQRGTGRSYPAFEPASTLTLDGAVNDTIAVTDHLRSRFDDDKVYLLGQSWGTLLGVLAAQRQPGLYRAFIGTGQMVSPLATDRIFYDDTQAWARERGDTALVDRLAAIGPPPYGDMLSYETALSYEHSVYPYDHRGNSEGVGGFSENFLVDEYALVDKVHLLGAFMDFFSVVYPQIQGVDLRKDAGRLEVPVYFVQGAHEADGRARPFAEWYGALEAPSKQLIVLDTSGHRPLFEQPDAFVDAMTQIVRSEAD